MFFERLFEWRLKNAVDGSVLLGVVGIEDPLAVLGPASEDICIVGEEVLSI